MLFISLVLFTVGSLLGAVPWLYQGEAMNAGLAFWCFVALIGFVGIVTKATEPKSPSDIFKNRRF